MLKVKLTGLPGLSFTARPEQYESIRVSSDSMTLVEGTYYVVEVPGGPDEPVTHEDVIQAMEVVLDDLEAVLLERLVRLKRDWQRITSPMGL